MRLSIKLNISIGSNDAAIDIERAREMINHISRLESIRIAIEYYAGNFCLVKMRKHPICRQNQQPVVHFPEWKFYPRKT